VRKKSEVEKEKKSEKLFCGAKKNVLWPSIGLYGTILVISTA